MMRSRRINRQPMWWVLAGATAVLVAVAVALVPGRSASVQAGVVGPTCGGQMATIVGTNGPNVLRGTPGNDVIAALGGADTVFGLGGDDLICGGDGPDVVHGGEGADTLFGDGGSDTTNGGAGADACLGEWEIACESDPTVP